MNQKIGIVQTRGIGDIIIALPIADHFIERGSEVYWPIDVNFVEMFRQANPRINFLPVERSPDAPLDFFLNQPLRLLNDLKVDRTILLYSYLSGLNVVDSRLARSLKFDEYKYAISGVPFDRKWTLKLERNLDREMALYESFSIRGDYVVVHKIGSNVEFSISLPPDVEGKFRVIQIEEQTENPFDWITTLERASELYLIDSCFANLVEQLNLSNRKHLYLRSDVPFTPVFKNGWQFSPVEPPKVTEGNKAGGTTDHE